MPKKSCPFYYSELSEQNIFYIKYSPWIIFKAFFSSLHQKEKLLRDKYEKAKLTSGAWGTEIYKLNFTDFKVRRLRRLANEKMH